MKYLFLLLLTGCGQFTTNLGDTSIIRGRVDNKPLVITSLASQAGVISSLTWDGIEFIEDQDHGASLQSAVGEELNPTEAGSIFDDLTSNPSTSVLLYNSFTESSLSTIVQAAYWHGVISPDLISKQVHIGYKGISNIIEYNVQFTVHDDHTKGTFESLTGYMPGRFNQYFTGTNFVTYCDASLAHCMSGVAVTPGTVVGSWGDSLQGEPKSTKWNLVWYLTKVPAQVYSFRMLVIIGTKRDVDASLSILGML